MRRPNAFTVIELLVVIAIIAVLVGMLFPAIGAVRRRAKQMENNTQVRSVVQGLIQASESNRGFFPGFDGFNFTDNTLLTTGNSGYGQTTEARFWILLDGNYTVGETIVSKAEVKDPWRTGSVTEDNYSYAMLKLANQSANNTTNVSDRYRREEWRNEQNTQAPIVSDRLGFTSAIVPAVGSPDTYLSIHDGSDEGEWLGSIGFGDLSVDFFNTSKIPTRFAGQNNVDNPTTSAVNEEDDIFEVNDGNAPEPSKDASMTYIGHNQPLGEIR